MPDEALVYLVNEWGSAPRERAGEEHQPFPARAEILIQAGVPRRLRPRYGDEALQRVADLTWPVFAASGRRDRSDILNTRLEQLKVQPRLEVADEGLRPIWLVPNVANIVLAAAVLTLREHVIRHPERVGVCVADRCVDVYLDASPKGERRFCSVKCQVRTRVASHRAHRGHHDTTPRS